MRCRATAAFEQSECLLPMLRLLQRPLPAVMGADVKPEEVFTHTLLAVRGLAKLSSYLYKVLARVCPRSPPAPSCLPFSPGAR